MRKILVIAFLIIPVLTAVPAFGQPPQIFSMEDEGYLGVGIRDVTSQDVEKLGLSEERGVFVTQVREDAPAEESGIRDGDVILEYSGQPVLNARQFRRMVADTPSGREVQVTIFRDGRNLNLGTRIGARKGPEMPRLEFARPFADRDAPHGRWLDRGPGPGPHSPGGRPRLGIRGDALTGQLAEFFGVTGGAGVLVTEVLEGTPAQEAGLRAGDVILSVNGDRVASVSDISRALDDGVVELEVVRDKQVRTMTAELKKEKGPSTRI